MLLRSPPFPGVAAARAAIGAAAPPGASAIPAGAIAAIASARVGGAFWRPPVPAGTAGAILVPPAGMAARTLVRAATAYAAPLVLLPPGRVAAALRRAGVAVATGRFDPWSIVAAGVPVVAARGGEIDLIATAAGVDIVPIAPDAAPPDRAAALTAALAAVRYRDPFTGRAATVGDAIALLADWRRAIDGNRPFGVAAGVAFWKRREVAAMLWGGDRPLAFAAAPARTAVRRRTGIAVWPSRAPAGLAAAAGRRGVPLAMVEDGFVRSTGLGSNLVPPRSLTLDARGIYYDPSRPSDLEVLLEGAPLPDDLVARAAALRRRLVAAGIGKYGRAPAAAPPRARPGAPLVLVAGQVEDDLSVLRGGGDVRSNLALLERARALEPDAEIWFRPHPDVDAGHRTGAIRDAVALDLADRVVREGGIAGLLAAADRIHVLTSLAGFEALLRDREAVVHGSPFYAGWGLTRDLTPPIARRTRKLTVDELTAVTLLLFPRYLDPVTGLPCPAEVLVDRIETGRAGRADWLSRLRMVQGRMRVLGRSWR